jgi:hypothetical protein
VADAAPFVRKKERRMCEGCREVRDSVSYVHDLKPKRYLCDACWVKTPPDGGTKRSGSP